MRRWIKLLLVASLLLGIAALLALGATWQGYWGGWKGLDIKRPHYEGAQDYEPGKWIGSSVCYTFVDTSTHTWTSEEKAVARAAIGEWDSKGFYLREPLRILESTDPGCEGRADIVIRWERRATFFRSWGDPNGDGFALNASPLVGFYAPLQVAPSLKIDPCSDLRAAGFLDRCSAILLNWENPHGWFVDPTPKGDEEFQSRMADRCGRETEVLKAGPGEAEDKHDLYTVIAHEFGHALGVIHSGGCDGNLLSGGREDDDGNLMWEGFLEDRRQPGHELETMLVGLGERRHLTKQDLSALWALYPRDP